MSRYCKHLGCPRLSLLSKRKCEPHDNPASRLENKRLKNDLRYKRLVRKLTKLPYVNRKKSVVIDSLLTGASVGSAMETLRTVAVKVPTVVLRRSRKPTD